MAERNKQRALLEHATGTYKTATGLLCADYFEKSEYSNHIYSSEDGLGKLGKTHS